MKTAEEYKEELADESGYKSWGQMLLNSDNMNEFENKTMQGYADYVTLEKDKEIERLETTLKVLTKGKSNS